MCRQRNLTLICLCVNACISNLLFSALSTILPEFAEDLISEIETGLVFAAFPLGTILAALFAGKMAQRFPPKHVMICGLIMTSIATAGFGLLQYVERSLFLGLGIVLRVWQGTGAAFSETAGLHILATSFPKKASRALSTMEVYAGVGLMAGPPFGGIVYGWGSFQVPFFVLAGALVIVFITVVAVVPSPQPFLDPLQAISTSPRAPLMSQQDKSRDSRNSEGTLPAGRHTDLRAAASASAGTSYKGSINGEEEEEDELERAIQEGVSHSRGYARPQGYEAAADGFDLGGVESMGTAQAELRDTAMTIALSNLLTSSGAAGDDEDASFRRGGLPMFAAMATASTFVTFGAVLQSPHVLGVLVTTATAFGVIGFLGPIMPLHIGRFGPQSVVIGLLYGLASVGFLLSAYAVRLLLGSGEAMTLPFGITLPKFRVKKRKETAVPEGLGSPMPEAIEGVSDEKSSVTEARRSFPHSLDFSEPGSRDSFSDFNRRKSNAVHDGKGDHRSATPISEEDYVYELVNDDDDDEGYAPPRSKQRFASGNLGIDSKRMIPAAAHPTLQSTAPSVSRCGACWCCACCRSKKVRQISHKSDEGHIVDVETLVARRRRCCHRRTVQVIHTDSASVGQPSGGGKALGKDGQRRNSRASTVTAPSTGSWICCGYRRSGVCASMACVIVGLMIMAAGMAMLAPAAKFIPDELGWQIAGIALIGVGAAPVITPANHLMLMDVTHLGSGSVLVVSSLMSFAFSFGEAIGPLLAGLVKNDDERGFITGSRIVILILFCVSLLAPFLSLLSLHMRIKRAEVLLRGRAAMGVDTHLVAGEALDLNKSSRPSNAASQLPDGPQRGGDGRGGGNLIMI